jgi:hypothetical protein
MYEVVKVVNGYEITRTKGTKGFYYVTLKEWDNGNRKYCTFRTIKAAAEFCETLN